MSNPNRYTISQAAKLLGKSPDTLRRWEEKGYISPARTPSGYREYTDEDIKHLEAKR